MHLLHIITSMDPVNGGPSQGIRNLDHSMLELGVTREIVCQDNPDSKYLNKEYLQIHAIGEGKGIWRYNKGLKGWLKENIHRFDVVVVNGLWLYHSYMASKMMEKTRKKRDGKAPRFLVMPHGMLDPYFQRAKTRRLKAIRNWFYWKLVERHLINNADGLLFTCETELLLARETFWPYHPKKEYNVGYGIDTPPVFNNGMRVTFQQLCPALKGEPYLLFLSRIHPKKGLDLLIQCYIEFSKAVISSGEKMPKLVIAGPGIETPYGQQLIKLISQEPEAAKDIFFPGMITGDAKWGAFYGCEAFILPSHQENFGIAVVEALACNKPVLISNQVNIWTEIKNGEAGIVENNNLTGVLNLLRKWLAMSMEDKTMMGNKARLLFEKEFDISKIAQNFVDAFNDKKTKATQ